MKPTSSTASTRSRATLLSSLSPMAPDGLFVVATHHPRLLSAGHRHAARAEEEDDVLAATVGSATLCGESMTYALRAIFSPFAGPPHLVWSHNRHGEGGVLVTILLPLIFGTNVSGRRQQLLAGREHLGCLAGLL
ncbi:hypothetical protein GUJ93_ZPchr0001g31711 [Zizania palustris]|uniref:Uncharacterized protein n=1 Tax=Zizania palustris TaxID=103762 RepID=A0A8J5UZW8_ZIZPA|nr:hypothetical protein GUJ93_ZPchr0001g31711 [Zizania palustris]